MVWRIFFGSIRNYVSFNICWTNSQVFVFKRAFFVGTCFTYNFFLSSKTRIFVGKKYFYRNSNFFFKALCCWNLLFEVKYVSTAWEEARQNGISAFFSSAFFWLQVVDLFSNMIEIAGGGGGGEGAITWLWVLKCTSFLDEIFLLLSRRAICNSPSLSRHFSVSLFCILHNNKLIFI